jgi:glutamine amidotransferase
MIVIVDYGMGNLRSVLRRVEKMGYRAILSSSPEDIEKAEKLILPGVGAIRMGMDNLTTLDLITVLNRKVLDEKTPILGICLGMQLMTRWSEEGNTDGLGWMDAETIKFNFEGLNDDRLRIPHMGWNTIHKTMGNHLLANVPDNARFYFVHSYHVTCKNPDLVLATTEYGYEFPSVIYKDHIFGTQFHPEKSHAAGVSLLEAFLGNN